MKCGWLERLDEGREAELGKGSLNQLPENISVQKNLKTAREGGKPNAYSLKRSIKQTSLYLD